MAGTKPRVKLIGQDGNVFNLIGLTKKTLVKAGMQEEANQFVNLAFKESSYGAVLNLISDYCEVE